MTDAEFVVEAGPRARGPDRRRGPRNRRRLHCRARPGGRRRHRAARRLFRCDRRGPAPLRRPADRRRGRLRVRPARPLVRDRGVRDAARTSSPWPRASPRPTSRCRRAWSPQRVWEVLAQGSERYGVFGHGYTYTAHPLAAAAALTNLGILERDGLVEQAAKRGAYLRERLHERFADHPLVGEVRGEGHIAAVEFVSSRVPARRASTRRSGSALAWHGRAGPTESSPGRCRPPTPSPFRRRLS